VTAAIPGTVAMMCVTLAQAGVQDNIWTVDSRLRGNDNMWADCYARDDRLTAIIEQVLMITTVRYH